MDSDSWYKWRMRLYLHLVALKRRVTLGTRALMIDGDKIYLIRHTYLPGWHFPGGGVEPGESGETSVAREVLEESGYRITGPIELFGFYHNTLITSRDHVALYLCRQFELVEAFKANYEIAEFGWFPVSALPAETSESTRRRLAEVFDGAPMSANW